MLTVYTFQVKLRKSSAPIVFVSFFLLIVVCLKQEHEIKQSFFQERLATLRFLKCLHKTIKK